MERLKTKARAVCHRMGRGAHKAEQPVHLIYFGALFLHVEWYYLIGGLCFLVGLISWLISHD